jgi:hypothetical protein
VSGRYQIPLLMVCLFICLTSCNESPLVVITTPLIVITYPANGQQLEGPDIIRAEASDPDGIQRVDFLINGEVAGSDDTAPFNWYWPIDFWGNTTSATISARAIDRAGDIGYTRTLSVLLPQTVTLPEPFEPISGSEQHRGEITLKWHPVSGAVIYEYEVYTDILMETILYSGEVGDTQVTILFDEDNYFYWHVRAFDVMDHETSWSSVSNFDINMPILYPQATNPSGLVANFGMAYSEMDITGYRGQLDDRFLFFFNSGGEFWTKEEDLISMDNMLSGEARTNSDGELTDAIGEIAVDLLSIREHWEPVSVSHPHFGDIDGVQKSLYQVRFMVYHSAGTIMVESNQTFYAVPKTVNGVTKWYMIGQQDEALKANEDISWGNLKALYR